MPSTSSSVVFFDGVCNFCDGTVNFIIRHDSKNKFFFASLQSEIAKQLLDTAGVDFDQQNLNTIILVQDGKVFKKSDAILEISKSLGGLFTLLYPFKIIPRFIRDGAYTLFARNRYRVFGKKDQCAIPSKEVRQKFL